MNSNFNINKIFEENLIINFIINDGTFTNNGQSYIIQHFPAIQNINQLLTWEHDVVGENEDNYFQIEYRISTDTVNWSVWQPMPNDFNNFINPNSVNLWLQIQYTAITDGITTLKLNELTILGIRNIDEIFEPIELNNNDVKIYTVQDTYKVFNLQDFNIFMSFGNINDLQIYYRFTQTQGRIWSEWVPLTKENLIKTRIERLKFCNFQFSFQNIGSGTIGVFDLELIGEFQNITADYKTMARLGLKTQCNPLANSPAPTSPCTATDTILTCVPCSESLTPWNNDIENCSINCSNYVQINDKSLWQEHIKLNQIMNDFISKVNSWKCTYLLTDPDGKGIDHVLHEQQIHNVIAMKDINIIVPDNQFPVDNLNFAGLDLDLIQSFEIHILKSTFKSTFGVEFRPSKRDVLYICDINQLWEVEQMFTKRSFMNAEYYYRVLMKKYNNNTSRQYANTTDGQNAKTFIDKLTKHTTLDQLFGIDVDNNIKQNTKNIDNNSVINPSQQYTNTSLLSIRKNMTNTKIVNDTIWNASLIIAKTKYEFPIKSKNIKFVEYNTEDNNVGKGDNRAISFWLNTSLYDPTWQWNILNNYDDTNNIGYKINIIQNALTLTFNTNTYQLPLNGFNINIWYCFLINIDQIQQKIELAIYTRQNENGATLSNNKLVLFNKLIFDINPIEFIHNKQIYIGSIDTTNTVVNNLNVWNLTNLRIYNQVLNKNVRNTILNENVISDAHLTILVDNAEDVLTLPKYGNL